jgi:hypothetical protein
MFFMTFVNHQAKDVARRHECLRKNTANCITDVEGLAAIGTRSQLVWRGQTDFPMAADGKVGQKTFRKLTGQL